MEGINKPGNLTNKHGNGIITPSEMVNIEMSKELLRVLDLATYIFRNEFPELYHWIEGIRNHKEIAKILCEKLKKEEILKILLNKSIDSNIKIKILEEIENKKLFEIDENLLNELNKSNTLELKKAGKITFIYSNHYKKSFVLFNGKKQIIEGNLFFNEKENYYYSTETIKYNEKGEKL